MTTVRNVRRQFELSLTEIIFPSEKEKLYRKLIFISFRNSLNFNELTAVSRINETCRDFLTPNC